MSGFRTEAACVLGVAHRDGSGTRPPSYEEICAFVNDAMEHLLDDSRVIDPVVSGRADAAEIEIAFALERSVADSGTDVAVFDIVYDMGAALGAEWNVAPRAARGSAVPSAKRATTLLTRQSQQVRDAAHTVAA